jgi:hypothetical protein
MSCAYLYVNNFFPACLAWELHSLHRRDRGARRERRKLHQQAVIGKILQHCGLWVDPPSRSPPKPTPSRPAPTPGRQGSLFTVGDDPDSRRTHEVDPDFLEFLRREDIDEPEPVWEP